MDEALIQKVMEEVIKTLNQSGVYLSPEKEGMPRMLVIGDFDDVPLEEKNQYILMGIDDYEKYKNIRRYQKVLITKLTLAQLSDIALGRDGSSTSCAVVNALLRGIDVVMRDGALWHRKLAGKGSPKLYSVLENNVRQLESYGVKIIEEQKPVFMHEPKPAKFAAPPVTVPEGSMKPTADRLITESIAQSLVSEGNVQVCVAKNAIITPSAWDIFKKNKVEIIKK